MQKIRLVPFLLLAVALLVASTAARADSFNVTLTQSSPFANQGETILFTSTVTADSSNLNPLDVVGDSITIDAPFTYPGDVDDSPFVAELFSIFLSPLGPGDSVTVPAFTVTVPAGTPSGFYGGFFDVYGMDNSSGSLVIQEVPFQFTVPEPSSVLLLGAGLLGMGRMLRRRLIG